MSLSYLITTVLGPAGEWRFVRAIVLCFAAAALARLVPLPAHRHDRRRRRSRSRARVALPVAGGAAMAVLASGCALHYAGQHDAVKTARATVSPVGSAAVTSEARAYAAAAGARVGVFEPSDTASYRLVDEFMHATGTRPAYVLYYSGWNDPFQVRFAGWAHAAGAVPFAQMEPNGVSMASIAAGGSDGYLRSFAAAVRGYGHPVMLGFAPEMNGGWYSWGDGHTSPAAWIAAWRHVVVLFRQAGATNVAWVWTVNSLNASAAPLARWWPGAAYVNWVGIDGYYYRSSDTFASVFGTTISQIRRFTRAPVLISETASGPGPEQAAQIRGLFAGVRANHLEGAVWFDMGQHDGPYHQDWRLEDSPAALAAFRAAAKHGSR